MPGPSAAELRMNSDFVEMLRALLDGGVEFLIIGAQALGVHGYVRATKDLDIWIRCSDENARRTWRALAAFGAPMTSLTIEDLTTPGTIYQIGVEPVRIDILTDVGGLDFEEAWRERIMVEQAGLLLPYLGRDHLISSNRVAGRPQDLIDIANIERLQRQ